MKKLLIFVCLLPLITNAQRLSENAEISVITCGPGQEALYTAFGHSAFRVKDPVNHIDLAYNYGVFDFRQKNFYLNFARGFNYYRLAAYDYRNFEYPYIYYNRYIHEQVLNLTQPQKQKLFDYLQWNALPENQQYLYDYFYDNCATRIRDVVKNVFGDSVNFDGSYVKTDYTIRELTDLYLKYQPWGDLGIDICLGLPMDKKASAYEYMFLPEYVESGFANATINNGNNSVPIVKQTIQTFEPEERTYSNGLFHPLYVFTFLFVIALLLTYRDYRRVKLTRIFDVVFFSVLGLLGLLFFLLWTATDHKAAANNLNILWALPTHLVAVIAMRRNPKWLPKYFLVTSIISLVLLVGWFFLPQKMHYALIPVVMTSVIRGYIQFYIRNKKELAQVQAPSERISAVK
jgi:hypothetical protein